MNRSKSAGQGNASKTPGEDIRPICKLIAPYIVHQWRGVCEELGVADDTLDQIEATHETTRMSEIAFKGLCEWLDTAGRAASKEKLHRVIQLFGLRRADEVLRSLAQKRTVPYMGRPATAAVTQEVPVNKQAKQKALADRLSRPKTTSDKEKKKDATSRTGSNPLTAHVTTSKPTDICEVKLKITVKGVQKTDRDEMEQTRDDFKSTKDDYKNTCFNFVKLVMANRRAHFRELKDLLGFSGISVQRLSKIGFNINVFLLCSSLGAFEILYQNYTTGRLKKIVHSALVTHDHLVKLNARQLELSVEMDDGMANKYRDILIVREPEEEVVLHPVDVLEYFQCDDDEECSLNKDIDKEEIRNFNLKTCQEELHSKIVEADEKCQQFDESVKDFLLILRIARPADKQEMTCLQDVINCYRHLKYSKSVAAQGSRSDLVYNYLAIVNFIRIIVQEISDKSLLVAFDETLHPDSCEAFHRILAQVEGMLHPGYLFEADVNITNAHVTTGLEKEMFGKFLCYLPKLLRLLYTLCDTLTPTISENDATVDNISEDADTVTDKKDSATVLNVPNEEKNTTFLNEENNNIVKLEDKNTNIPANTTSTQQPSTNTPEQTGECNGTSAVNYVPTWTQG